MGRRTLNLFVAILAVLAFSFSTAHSGVVLREGNTFKMDSTAKKKAAVDEKTAFTWQDNKGNTYPIYRTKSGACYVLKTSKNTGKEYKYYLPKEVKESIGKESK